MIGRERIAPKGIPGGTNLVYSYDPVPLHTLRYRATMDTQTGTQEDTMPKRPPHLEKRDVDALADLAREDHGLNTSLSDDQPRGLYFRARRGEVTAWFRYRRSGGGRGWRYIGRYGDLTLTAARKAASAHVETQAIAKAQGLDLGQYLDREDRADITVAQAMADYLEDLEHRADSGARKGKPSSLVRAQQVAKRNVLPKFGRKSLGELTVEAVREWHKSMRETPGTADRALVTLSTAIEFARRSDPEIKNPCTSIVRYGEQTERRGLTRDELQRLGEVLHQAETGGVTIDGKIRKIHPSGVLAIRFLALTGFRRSELLGEYIRGARGDAEGLRWRDVDLDAGVINLKSSKGGPQVRTIGKAVIDLLRPLQGDTDAPVCPGTREGQPFIGINEVRRKLWQAAGIPLVRGVDLHSLRHSFITIGKHVADGRYSGLLSAVAGHGHRTSKSITKRYIDDDPDALRPAANAISSEIAGLLGLRAPADVLEMRRRA